jgi:hypothetical protein
MKFSYRLPKEPQMQFVLEPQVGDIGLVDVKGGLGAVISFLQYAYSGNVKALHSFLVLEDGMILESNYRVGARIVSIDKYIGKAVYLSWNLTTESRKAIAEEAKKYVSVKYSYLEYLYMTTSKFGRASQWLSNKIISSNKYICSSLIACIYGNAGVSVFDKPYLLVTPGDIFKSYLQSEVDIAII